MPNAKRLPSGNWQVKVYSHTEYVDGKPKRIRECFTAQPKPKRNIRRHYSKGKTKGKPTVI